MTACCFPLAFFCHNACNILLLQQISEYGWRTNGVQILPCSLAISDCFFCIDHASISGFLGHLAEHARIDEWRSGVCILTFACAF